MDSKQWEINSRSFEEYAPLQRVKRYVEEHFSEKITLSAAARIAGMESTYFSYFFHRKTGICFGHWLRRLRVERATGLIARTDKGITIIAYEVGFCDLRTFERAFKGEMAMTPREFRNRCRSPRSTKP